MRKIIQENKLLSALAGFAVVLGLVIVIRVITAPNATITDQEAVPAVTVLTLADHATFTGSVQTIGTVESLQQVDLQSQIAAKVERINVALGQQVVAGQTLVTLEGSELRASVAQAEAGVEAERVRLAEMQRGLRPEELKAAQDRVTNAEQSLADAQKSLQTAEAKAVTDLQNTRATAVASAQRGVEVAKSALLTVTDLQYAHYLGNDFTSLQIVAQKEAAMRSLYDIATAGRWARPAITEATGGVYSAVKNITEQSSAETIADAVSRVVAAVRDARSALDSVPEKADLTDTERATLATQKATVTAELNGLLADQQALATQQQISDAAVIAARSQVNAAQSALSSAQNDLTIGLAGASTEALQAQQARIKSAEATYAGLAAQLSKTIIRTPISGTVAKLDINLADLVSPGTLLVSVVDVRGLQVKAYISASDRGLVSEGSQALIDGNTTGVVTAIAPSIDAQSGKVEVLIAVTAEQHSLTVGDLVDVLITGQTTQAAEQQYVIPLRAVRATPDGSLVYVIDETGAIAEVSVTTGRVIGQQIQILEGITPDMQVISSVRGLKAGQQVEVRQ